MVSQKRRKVNISDVLAPITQAQPGASLALIACVAAVPLVILIIVVYTVVAAVKENDSTTYDRIIGLIRVSRRGPGADEDPRS
ncbi:hypothetical protein GCM10023094_36220 [Rhodococcus olei]|uniref:Uncharacterized protein n=1 Tax=Rhodococcus olei TaxID=2161675 RepID=A0ABP8PCD4_9NOCA